MALSGSLNTTAYSGRYLVLSWTATQSVEDNTSKISWTLKGAGGSTTKYYKAGNFKVVIAGETVYSSSSRINLYNGTTVASGTITIKHNTDGSKSFSASAAAGIYYVDVNCSGSGSFALNSIPRAATITSAPNFNDEENPTISYSNPAGSSVESLQVCLTLDGSNDDIAYRSVSKTDSSYTFSLTDAERKVLRAATTGSNSRKIGFYLKTTIGSSTFYSKVWKTFSIINGKPTLSPSVKDTGAISTVLTGNTNVIIGNYNTCVVSTGALAKKEASITKQSVTCGGKVLNAASGTLNYVTSGVFDFSVTDNRGNTTTQTVTKSFVDYAKPTCNLGIAAPTTAGTMEIAISGKWFNGSFGAVTNTLAVQFRIKENNGNYSEWQDIIAIFDNNEYSGAITLEGLNYQNTYTVQARAVDEIGQRDSNYIALTNERTVKTTPVYDWGKNDFSVNVPLYVQGSPVVDFVIEQGTEAMGSNGVWKWRKFASGRAECWGVRNFGNMAVTTAFGTLFQSASLTQDLPSGLFNAVPDYISMEYISGTYSGWVLKGTSEQATATSVGNFIVVRPTSVNIGQVYIGFNVIGKWK